jgi:ferrochelatase
LVAEQLGRSDWQLVYQSRSGPASQPWLEPDILDYLREVKSRGNTNSVIIAPIGFVSDHMEIIFDLDTQARALCEELGLTMVRAQTAGTHPRFIQMIRELITERLDASQPRPALGVLGPRADICPADCCPMPARPTRP